MKRVLCWLGVHDWQPQQFLWRGGHGTGRECSRCHRYKLESETWA